MKNILATLLALLMTVNLVGCSTNTQEQNTATGAIAGALIGGGAGAFVGQGIGKAVAIGVGIVGGALLGGYIGNHMDSSDNAKMNTAMDNSTYKSTTWTNPKSGSKYTMTPTSNTMAMNGNASCRQFHTTAVIEGKNQEMNGTACRQSDGSWKAIHA